MRALSHCDFCGDDATGTFELLPPELEPTEDEQRRVVLCRECGRRLEDLLEPLLARAGVESDNGTSAIDSRRQADSDRSSDSTDDSAVASGSELETADDDTASDSTDSSRPTVIDVNAAKTDPKEDEVSTDTGSDESKTADSDEPNSTEPAAADDRGITLERTADADSDEQNSDSADDDGGSSDAADSTGSSDTSPPRGYGKVIRLLRNREFPMARSDVETLAAGAYDLESHTIEEIIEYALKDGEFAEDGDQLVRP